MRTASFFMGICALLTCGPAIAPPSLRAQSAKATPLILEENEGERRVWRPVEGLEGQLSLFILKVDPHNGGSSHLVFGTEGLPPGGKIEAHRHPGSDEILFLQNGLARVGLGDAVREVHGGSTVFIPAGTWISVVNTGKETIRLVFVFSAPGFDEFMRAESVREGEKVVPLTRAEDAAILAKHAHAVIYKELESGSLRQVPTVKRRSHARHTPARRGRPLNPCQAMLQDEWIIMVTRKGRQAFHCSSSKGACKQCNPKAGRRVQMK